MKVKGIHSVKYLLEPEIGEVFEKDGRTVRCEEKFDEFGCRGCCAFYDSCDGFECTKESREDGKEVYFKEMNG